jgi:hypothetical protein
MQHHLSLAVQEVVEKPDFLGEFANQSVQCGFWYLLQNNEAGEI